MGNCIQCGLRIPEGQRVCSMCYGDIDYGRDGEYRRQAEALSERIVREESDRRHFASQSYDEGAL